MRRHAAHGDGVYETVHRSTLARFLPAATRASLEQTLADAHITPTVAASTSAEGERAGGGVDLSQQLAQITRSAPLTRVAESKIPEVVFYENEQVQKAALLEHSKQSRFFSSFKL